WLACAFAGVAAGSLFLSASGPAFYGGYVLMVIAGLLFAPTLTLFLSKAMRPLLQRVFPAEGTLAADSLVQAPRRTSATTSALMLSLAMVVGFGGFSHSFYRAIENWLNNVMNPDFYISSSSNLTSRSFTFPSELGAAIKNVDGVDQVQLVRNAR